MATVLKDRVKVSSGTNGAGTITLGAAATGYQDFAAIGNGNVTYYTIALQSGSEWEVGRGTVTQVTGIWYLSRDVVLESSNAGALVVFSTGTKDVFVTYPAERAIYLDDAGTYPVQNTFNTLNATTATLTGGTVSTTPSSGTDLVNKSYVDTVAAQGIVYHNPVYVESPDTAGNLTALYNQPGGPGVGVGATLTNNGAKAALVIDGVLMTTTKRVLIYNQTNAFENGVYTVTTVGTPDPGGTNWVLTRATDADTYAVNSPTSLGQGDAFFVSAGNTGAGELYSCNTVGTIIFGTTNITFAQISATVPYMAGTGLNLSPSTTFNISNVGTAGTYGSASSVPVFATNAQGQVTSATPTAIAIAAAAVSGLAASATTDTTNAANITSGTLPSGRLNGSYTGITGVGTLAAGTWNGSVIAAVYGGTGISSYTTGDLLYASSSTAISNLADVIAGNALLSGGVSSNPAWGKIGLTTHVDGTLPVGNGGTGATTLTGYVYGNGTGAMTASTSIPNAATTATSANTASAIVARDASGNFTAGTITAALNGNATTATTAANVNNGTLSMAVSGTGLSGSASFTANQSGNSTFTVTSNATNLNTASTVVARDASGNFVAGTITAALSGNATTATSATTAGTATNLAAGVAGAVPFQSGAGATGFSAAGTSGQYLQSNGTTAPSWITPPAIGNGALTLNVSGTGLSGSQTFTANQAGAATFTVTSNATSANTASAIVARDGSGNFIAGTITAALSGNATTATSATTATTAGSITSQANSATITASVAANGNQIVLRDGNADDYRRYGFAEYFNMSHGVSGTTTDTIFYSSGDNYIRKNNATGLRGSLNVPTRTGGDASGTWGINITGSSGSTSGNSATVGGYSVSTAGSANTIPTRNASGYLSPANWIQFDGAYGLYWPSQYGAHFSPNDTSSYTQLKLQGTKNSYSGLYDVASAVNGMMYDASGNGGVYRETNGRWYFYHNVSNACTAFGTSTTNSAYGLYSVKGIYAEGLIRAGTNFYADVDYGYGMIGLYNSTIFQGVFAMGDAYKLTAGGAISNLYGMTWSHPNAGGIAANLDSHGLIVAINGGFGSCLSYSIKASGNVTAYSDERLKRNWEPLCDNFVEKLAKVKVGTYERIDLPMVQVGVSAQSLESVLPEAVSTASDDMKTKSVAYGNAALASAVMLAQEIVDLKLMVQQMQVEIEKLKRGA